jgi:hypothetical protein
MLLLGPGVGLVLYSTSSACACCFTVQTREYNAWLQGVRTVLSRGELAAVDAIAKIDLTNTTQVLESPPPGTAWNASHVNLLFAGDVCTRAPIAI